MVMMTFTSTTSVVINHVPYQPQHKHMHSTKRKWKLVWYLRANKPQTNVGGSHVRVRERARKLISSARAGLNFKLRIAKSKAKTTKTQDTIISQSCKSSQKRD